MEMLAIFSLIRLGHKLIDERTNSAPEKISASPSAALAEILDPSRDEPTASLDAKPEEHLRNSSKPR